MLCLMPGCLLSTGGTLRLLTCVLMVLLVPQQRHRGVSAVKHSVVVYGIAVCGGCSIAQC